MSSSRDSTPPGDADYPCGRELHEAYMAATYRVDLREVPEARTAAGTEVIDLRIGQTSPALDRLLRSFGSDGWAFITAENPESTPLSTEENQQRQEELRSLLVARGWRFFPATGCGESGQERWSEASFLILDISREDAVQLGVRFDQNAIVTGHVEAPAELQYCPRQ